MEEGVPVIIIETPAENTTPTLIDGENFSLEGKVLNLTPVDFLRIAWVPPELDEGDAGKQLAKAKEVLLENSADNSYGIKMKPLTLSTLNEKEQLFKTNFNLFTNDFEFTAGQNKNAPKFFVLYTKGKAGHDVFQTFRLLPHTTPPMVNIVEPANMHFFSRNTDIQFTIEVTPSNGVPVESVTLESVKENNKNISLTGAGLNRWTGLNRHADRGDYQYRVIARDKLGNEERREWYIRITDMPDLIQITSGHEDGTLFSGRDTISIQTVFSGAVGVTTTGGTPRLVLEGFTDGQPRYAIYQSGNDSTTLNFTYAAQPNDRSDEIKVTRIDLNGGSMGANAAIPPSVVFDKNFKIDGIAPVISGISFTGKGDPAYTPWLKAGEELEIQVTTSKPITILGSPKLILTFDDTGEHKADFQSIKPDNNILVFSYKVQPGDAADPVRYDPSACFSPADLELIIDKTGARQGNCLSLAGTSSLTNTTIKVDANSPDKLTIEKVDNKPEYLPLRWYRISDGIEPGTTVEYTPDGQVWNSNFEVVDNLNYVFKFSAPQAYNVFARQTDQAGNVSPQSSSISFTIDSGSTLAAVTCNQSGNVRKGSTLTFNLIFMGNVNTFVGDSGPEITVGCETEGKEGDNYTLKLAVDEVNIDNVDTLTFEWKDIPEGYVWEPLKIIDINLKGVTLLNGGSSGSDVINNVKDIFNKKKGKINLLTNLPVIKSLKNKEGNEVNLSDINNPAETTALSADGDKSILKLEFSQAVSPANGTIIVKPHGEWLVPPVLTTEEYYNVTKTMSITDKGEFDKYYTKTTHGLLKNNSGNYTGTPDTATKYVLKFDYGLDVAGLRDLFDKVHYLWQEIDVNLPQVSGWNTQTITVDLDRLPEGRMWDIAIRGRNGGGAIRDRAGNTFADWPSSSTWNTFWSAGTAMPVIRVNRYSHNSRDDRPLGIVEYRIDCETPGVETISYGTREISYSPRHSRNADIESDMTSWQTYNASSTDGSQNSNIGDATAADLGDISASTHYSGTELNIGDGELYTARKYYIAAKAKRGDLNESERGYEGAFKTLVVYRNTNANGYVKFEGNNLYGGQPTIDGFPLAINDYKSSKYAYKNGNDWIWISWEIVSDFYQNGVKITGEDSNGYIGAAYAGDTAVFSFRKYGNYGLRVGIGSPDPF